MKLVDILARELKVWPEGYDSLRQSFAGMVFHGAKDGILPIERLSVAEDFRTAAVTRSQWQAAVDALKADEIAYSAENVNVNVNYATHASLPANAECKIVQPEWNGEGLPPVGAACEFQMALAGWVPATITAVTEKSIVFTRPLFKDRTGLDYENTHEEILPHHALKRFRPIRTPEQIAAEARQKAINQICIDAGSPEMTPGQLRVASKLYDAGYRKFEIVDN